MLGVLFYNAHNKNISAIKNNTYGAVGEMPETVQVSKAGAERKVCQLSRLSLIFLDEIRQVNNQAVVNRISVSNESNLICGQAKKNND